MTNYSTTVRLCPSENERPQFVFASQAYGTFYAVYAKFHTSSTHKDQDETKSAPKDKVGLNNIDLELINYKGLINISLEGAQVTKVERDGKNQSIEVTIIVKGVVFTEPRTHMRVGNLSLITDGIILTNADFTVIRDLRSLNGQTHEEIRSDDCKKSRLGGVFDDEFFFRNGQLEPKQRPDYDSEYSDELAEKELDLLLGKWCTRTRSKIRTS